MKKIILSIAICFLINTKSFGHVEHYVKYNYLEYELFRNNNSIGYHKYDFNINILQRVKKIIKEVFLRVIFQKLNKIKKIDM